MRTEPARCGDPAVIPGFLLGVVIILWGVGYMLSSFNWVPGT